MSFFKFAIKSFKIAFILKLILSANLDNVLENTINHAKQSGWMRVTCGSMFLVKLRNYEVRRAEMVDKVEIFKPKLIQGMMMKVVSHNHNKIMSTPVESSNEILLLGSHL